MKHIIILGDGMADWPVESLGGKTLLQYADTPNMDKLARMGRNGLLRTIPDGFHPGSEVANSSILGFDQHLVYEGRGPLEAASIGIELEDDDLALRCNFICIENEKVKNHSCGRLETEEADVLIAYLQKELGNDRIRFYTGVQYRHLLVVKGGKKQLKSTPPHDIPGKPYCDYLIEPETLEATETAQLLNNLIVKSQQLLKYHPLNILRMEQGKDPANSIWPWGGGYRPKMIPLTVTYPQIKQGSVITAVDLIRGIGAYAGLRVINVEGATGLYDTNYEGKAQAALEALQTGDFVYLHVEASDEAGHDGDLALKIKTIENLDKRTIGPIMRGVEQWEEKVAISVLPDHPTPCEYRTHTSDPVPFVIYYPGIAADAVQTFDEETAGRGAYGILQGDEFINELMKI